MGRGTVAPQNVFLENVIRSCNDRGTIFLISNVRLDDFPIVYCSDSFVALMGHKKTHVMGKGGICHFLHGAMTQSNIVDDMRMAMMDKNELQREVVLYQKSGTPMWLLVHLMTITCDSDLPILFLLTFRDISSLKDPITQAKRSGWAALIPKTSNKTNVLAQATHKQAAKTRATQLANLVSIDASFMPPRYSSEMAKPPKYIILHYHPMKTIWDWIILVLTLYTAVAVPFAASFNHISVFMSVIDTLVDILFMCDIGINFRTTYVDKDGTIILQPKLIRRNYLRRWFIIDAFAAVPYGIVTFFTNEGVMTDMFGVVKVIRLMRLSRVARKLDYYLQFGATTLVLWLCAFCLCAHWMACVWYVIGYYYDHPDKQWGWLYQLATATQQPYIYVNGTLIEDSGPTIASLYMSALYYTMSSLTTCGFGNIAPTTTAEKLFGCVSMLMGCVLYAFIFGQVTAIIQQLQRQSSVFHQTLSNMKRFIKLYKLPQSLAMRLIDYYVSTWAINKGVDVDAILQECPKELQADVCVHMHRPILDHIDIFVEAPPSALSAMGRHFWTLRTAPGDRIVQNGESLDVLYFIGKGSLEIKLKEEIYGMLGSLDSFGSITDTEFEQSIYDVHALTYCDLHCVKKIALHEALAGYPDYYDTFLDKFSLTFNLGKTRAVAGTSSQSLLSLRGRSKPKSTVKLSKLLHSTRLDAHGEEETELDSNRGIAEYERHFTDETRRSLDGVDSPNVEVLSGLNDLKSEVRTEIARINSKMGLVEEQVTQVLKLLQTQMASGGMGSTLDEKLRTIQNFEIQHEEPNDTTLEEDDHGIDEDDSGVAMHTKKNSTDSQERSSNDDLPFWLSKS